MGDRLKFGKIYKAYCRIDGEIVELDVELAEIRHYRKFNSNITLHNISFWIKGDKTGIAWLDSLNSRPTSLPTGYMVGYFRDSANTIRLITFERELLEETNDNETSRYMKCTAMSAVRKSAIGE